MVRINDSADASATFRGRQVLEEFRDLGDLYRPHAELADFEQREIVDFDKQEPGIAYVRAEDLPHPGFSIRQFYAETPDFNIEE